MLDQIKAGEPTIRDHASENASSDNRPERERVISAIYEAVLHPELFSTVTAEWEDHLKQMLDETAPDDASGAQTKAEPEAKFEVDPSLKAHFDRAHELLGQIRRKAPLEDLEQKIANTAGFAILARANGRIRSVSNAVESHLGPLQDLKALQQRLSAQSSGKLEKVLRAASRGLSENTSVVLATDFRPRHLLARVTACADTAGQVMIEGLDYHWSQQAGAMLVTSFGLSRAEIEIVRGLMTGRSLREIAFASQRSEHTVRNQMKSVLAKTGAPGQADLIRLIALLIDKSPRISTTRAELEGLSEERMQMRSGLRMQFYTGGDPDGAPILFLHGMLDGVAALDFLNIQFAQRGLRVIAPIRPGYGQSDPVADADEALEVFVSHVGELLDRLGLRNSVVLGHMAGAVIGHILCHRLKQSIAGMVAVSAAGPMRTRRQFARMAPRQRVMAYTARYAPALLPFFVRAGVSLLQSDKPEAFIDALYPPGTHERQVIDRLKLSEILLKGYRSSAQSGAVGFIQDGLLMVRDWMQEIDEVHAPVIHLHGAHDPVIPVDEARVFAQRASHVTLRVSAEAGQFLLYEQPEGVIDALWQVIQQSQNAEKHG